MANRIRLSKTVIETLPLPPAGKRTTIYDTKQPRLAVRITSTGVRTFYVIKRDGVGMAWVKLGTFPDMTVEQASKSAIQALADLGRGMNPAAKKRAERQKATLGDAYKRYVDLYVGPQGVKTAAEIQAIWERFLGPMPDAKPKKHGRKRSKHAAGVDWAKRKLDAIDKSDVLALHVAIGATHRTMANRVIELISAIYNHAINKAGFRGDNPAQGIQPFKENKRRRFLNATDPHELKRFFEALATDTSEDFKHFVILSLLTGARRGNVLAMRWQDINLQAAYWSIPTTKNDEPQTVPLVPETVAILNARTPQADGFVFAARSKTGHMHPPKKRWRELLKRAGINDLRIHDLRRSLGSWQAISGASLAIIGESLGHKSADATLIYARLNLDPVRASVQTATSTMLEAAGVKRPAEVKQIKSKH